MAFICDDLRLSAYFLMFYCGHRRPPVFALSLRGYIGYTSPMTVKDAGKDSGFRIRVERDLRDKFIQMCRAKDRPAAQVIRDFMRQYIEDNAVENAAKKDKRQS